MVDKKIQFNIVIGGIPQIKSSLQGVTASARAMEMNLRQMSERTAQRIIELNRAKEVALKRLSESGLTDIVRIKKREEEIEARTARAILAIKERAANSARHLNEKVQHSETEALRTNVHKINWMSVAGHAAGSGGFYKTGHVLRMANQLGIGSSNSPGIGNIINGILGGAGGGGGTGAGAAAAAGAGGAAAGGAAMTGASMVALGAAAASVAVVLGTVYVAAKLMEYGFESVAAQSKYLATSFLGAATQIGGAKNLQEIIVNAAEKESLIKKTRFEVDASERLSEAELQSRASSISTRADLGAPEAKDVIESQRRISILTGKQRSVPQSSLEFIAKLSHIGGVAMPEMANTYGQVLAQNKNSSPKEIEDLFRAAVAIGQKGAFSVSDIPSSRKLIQVGGQLAGSGLDNTRTALAIGTILRPRSGTLEQAGTEYQSFVKAAQISHRQGDLSQDTNKYFNKAGQITNINQLIAKIVATPYMERPKAFGARIESTHFLSNMARQAGIEDTDTPQQQKEKVLDLLGEFQNATMSIEEFNRANEEATSTHDKLTAAFNLITDRLGTAFLPILEQLVPDIELFAKVLVDNKDQLSEVIKNLINSMILLVPASLEAVKGLLYLGQFFGIMVSVLAKAIDESFYGVFHRHLQPFIKAGDVIAESQAKMIPMVDTLIAAAEKFKLLVDGIQAPKTLPGATPPSIPEVTIVGHVDVVRAIKDLHRDITPHFTKQPDW